MPVTAAVLVAADGDFPGIPGQPYVSPDDLASIGPLWQQAVQQQLVPIVAEVYQTSAGVVHAQMVDATQVPTLPSVGSLAAEQYLAAATNTFAEVGDDLWATARSELLDGFEKGESIDQLAARLRASAGMTAKKATLVARTQVLDASNAGSIATARAAGIDMQKEWMSAEDARVRPEHVLANGQKVDLNAKFTVGGYECDRPHDPTLPPALRYSCRCTTGYLIPDDSVDDAVDDARPVPPIPGTSGVVEPLPDPYAGDLVSPALPGPQLGVPTVPGGGLTVRAALQAARTTSAVSRVFADEYLRITGRTGNGFNFQGSAATAREHAEGLLTGLERFPDARLDRVTPFSISRDSIEYAHQSGSQIGFNYHWTTAGARKQYLESIRSDEASRWHVPGSGNPAAVALHEFGHILDTTSDRFKVDLDALLARSAAARDADLAAARAAGDLVDADDFVAGGGVDGLIRRHVSSYGTKNRQELAAEAFADVMINGDRASDLSRDIFTLLEAEYRRGGGVIRPGPEVALPSLPGPATAAQFEVRATAALRGKAADERPRVQAEIDAKNLDSATWKATGFDGLDRPVPGGTTAVTTYLRRPAFANDRLRFPDGRPRQDWEPPVDPAKAAKDAAAADRQIANLDKLMAESPLDSDTVVWRGARPVDIGLPDGDPVGFEWTDRGFVSTTGRRSVAENDFAQSENAVLLRILAPDGTPALGFQGLGEAEVLLGRGLTFRVVAEHARLSRTSFSGKKLPGARVLDVEIVPAAPVAAPAPAAVAARSVAQLRALAQERGITIPAGSKKADIVRLLDEGPTPGPAVPAAAPRLVKARAGSTIGDVELGPTQFQIAIGEADLPRRPVGDFTDRPYDGPDGAVVHRGTPLPAGFDSPLVDIRRGEYTVRPGLTDAESQALDRYVLSRVADPLNTALRQGTTPPYGTVKIADQVVDLDDVAVQLDAAIGASELAADTILYRGALMRPADLRKLQPGAITREDAFLSTTTESENAFEIIHWRKGRDPAGGKSPVIFEILAPRGTAGAVADVGEREVLLGRGRRFRVVEVRRPTTPGGTRRIVLEILPDTPAPLPAPVAAPSLASRTVPQLRALAKERGITIPPGSKKADIVRLLDEGPAPTPQAAVDFDVRVTAARTGIEALDSAPVRLSYVDDQPRLTGLSSLPKAERERISDAVSLYSTGTGGQLNDFLRFGQVDDFVRPFVEDIQTAMRHSLLPKDVVVWRGVDRSAFDLSSSDLTGYEWVEPTFQSTAVVRREAEKFGGVLMRIIAPKGSPALRISDLEGEAELLLGAGQRFRVVRDLGLQPRADGLSGGPMRVLDVEIIPAPAGVVEVPLAKRTVAQLRALAAERNITVPKGARKPDIVRLLETPVDPAAERAAARAAARATNELIEQSSATARVLAEVDELLAKKASAATIREALDDALAAPGQLFAGADLEVLSALRAVASDAVKLRATVTRLGGKAKIKPVSKAGAKVTYDPATMEGVGGIDIPDGTRVTVVRRGSTVTLPDGTVMQLEKARVTPVTAPAKKAAPPPEGPSVGSSSYRRAKADLREVSARPILGDPVRQEGDSAFVFVETHTGDAKLVTKDFTRAETELGQPSGHAVRDADSEELGALVGDAVGLRSPAVVRTGPTSIQMEFIDGLVGGGSMRQRDALGLRAFEDYEDTDDGRLIGLLDLITGNSDRGSGNWIVRPEDGRIVSIDMGTAFDPATFAGGNEGNFAYHFAFDGRWKPNDMDPRDMAAIRARLEALKPEFDRLGRDAWYRQMMSRFEQIEKRARGTTRRISDAFVAPVKKAAAPKKTPAAKVIPAKVTPPRAPRAAAPQATYQLPPGVTTQDATALRLALKRRQPIEGMPGADNAGLVERLAVENNAADYLLGQFQSHVPAAGRMTTAQLQADLAARAKAAFADRTVATNVDNARLEEILTGGRFKTQFETGRSGGMFQPQERAVREEQWFGIPTDAAPETRPIYGYLVTGGDGKGIVDVYGGARVVFRDDVRGRTTAQVGDSMEHILTGRPAPVDNPDWYAFTIQYEEPALAKLDRNYDGPAFNKKTYIEAQIHGGVTVDDIAEVIFTSRPTPELVALLRERGIPWRMRRR